MIQGRKRLNTMGYQFSYALHIYVSYQYARKKYNNGELRMQLPSLLS